MWKAFDQLQTYQAEISDLLVFNEALVVSDGMNARVGSLTASKEWFMPWRTISNQNDKPQVEFELEKVVRGFFRPDLFDLRPRANPTGDLRRAAAGVAACAWRREFACATGHAEGNLRLGIAIH